MLGKTALRRRRELAVALAALCLLTYGGWGAWKAYRATHSADSIAGIAALATDPAAIPDETPIDTAQPYAVADDLPKLISLPSLGVQGFVQRISADSAGTLAVPTNVHVAGWYVGSAKPGEAGLSIIDGHLQGKYREGIFKRLGDLKAGDGIEITFGDGSVKKFAVVHVQSYALADAGAALFVHDPAISSQLTLITCAGQYDTQAQAYAERVIVTARYVP